MHLGATPAWEKMTDKELLKLSLRELDLRFINSQVELSFKRLCDEMKEKKLRFRPHIWISTEWFSPYGVAGFAIPFYLLHPRLAQLEKQFIGEAEGYSMHNCLRLMRHECGHAIDNAFGLRRYKRRQALFGLSGKRYPKSYWPDFSSRYFVRHLKDAYAQAHPDEDWAESFAVWLNPDRDWKTRYAKWPVMRKLMLIDEMMARIRGKKQINYCHKEVEEISTSTQTLESYFLQKSQRFKRCSLAYCLTHVAQLYSRPEEGQNYVTLDQFLRVNRKEICQKIAFETRIDNHIIMKAFRDVLRVTSSQPALGLSGTCEQARGDLLRKLAVYAQGYAKDRRYRIAM